MVERICACKVHNYGYNTDILRYVGLLLYVCRLDMGKSAAYVRSPHKWSQKCHTISLNKKDLSYLIESNQSRTINHNNNTINIL